jgi:hypothetical protein
MRENLPIDEGAMVPVTLDMLPTHRDKLQRLGGAAWVREKIDQALPMGEPRRATQRAKHRAKLIESAKAGDAEAGRALLTHAMLAISRAVAADEADRTALAWVVEALRLTVVDGSPIDRAFGVERVRGRPPRHPLADVADAALIVPEVEKLTAKFKANDVEAPKRKAVQKVAELRGVSESEIRRLLALGAPASRSPKSE